MAEVTDYFFHPPQWLTFTHNEYQPPKRFMEGFLYWFAPGCRTRLRAYTEPEDKFVYSGYNRLDNWDATGDAMSRIGKRDRAVNLYEEPYGGYPLPWAPTENTLFDEFVQVNVPYVENLADGEVLIDGTWNSIPPRTWLNNANTRDAGYPGYNPIDAVFGNENLQNYMTVQSIARQLQWPQNPKVKVFDEILEGTGFISTIEDLGVLPGLALLRTEIIALPSDMVAYRAIIPQVFKCGFVAFGKWQFANNT
jgi:hypothetical protein